MLILVNANSIAWLKVAASVNQGVGAFSDFIRSYTSYQHELRYGIPLSIAELQALSDGIAEKVLRDVVFLHNTRPDLADIPSLSDIGIFDAQTVVDDEFNGNANAWSGVLLFPFLGDSSYLNNLLSDTNADSTYDTLAIIGAARHALGANSLLENINLLYQSLSDYGISSIGVAATVVNNITDFVATAYGTTAYNAAIGNVVLGKTSGAGNPLDDAITSVGTPSSIEFIHTGAGNDIVIINSALSNNLVDGADGNDIIEGGQGSDLIDGGVGSDTVSYATSTAWVNVDLGINNQWNGDAAWDNVMNVENIIGSSFNDQLIGDAGANQISGGAGNDSITGGLGSELFVYKAVSDSGIGLGNRDIITDFGAIPSKQVC